MADTKIRLYLDQPMGEGQTLSLGRDQAHYLFSVMRCREGDNLFVFNGRDGEWWARIDEIGKRTGQLSLKDQTAPQQNPPDIWLVFAPIKKARTDFIVEKAAELGVARILPVRSQYTNSERLNLARLNAHAVEAAEQCGGTYVPSVEEIQPLDRLLASWPSDRALIFCDETRVSEEVANDLPAQPAAVLIGPEGGFSPQERDLLIQHAKTSAISLGPRILRADTAAVAALTLWQSKRGDWTATDDQT